MRATPQGGAVRDVGVSRRGVGYGVLAAVGGTVVAGCGPTDGGSTGSTGTRPAPPTPEPRTGAPGPGVGAGRPRVLVAYFSRAGENYYYGGRTDLEVGNTEVLARMIADLVPCDRYEICPVDPYPDDYDATVQRNSREQETGARPAIVGDLPDVGAYDVFLLGSGIWSVRPPMIMSTFVESVDLSRATVHPFVTYAVSGLGSTEEVYAQALPGTDLGEALAVRGEEVADSRADVVAWLRRAGLPGPGPVSEG